MNCRLGNVRRLNLEPSLCVVFAWSNDAQAAGQGNVPHSQMAKIYIFIYILVYVYIYIHIYIYIYIFVQNPFTDLT